MDCKIYETPHVHFCVQVTVSGVNVLSTSTHKHVAYKCDHADVHTCRLLWQRAHINSCVNRGPYSGMLNTCVGMRVNWQYFNIDGCTLIDIIAVRVWL